MQRYSRTHQVLHWLTAGCLFALIVIAWVMTATKPGPGAATLYNWHKTLGMAVMLMTVFRIVWRLREGPPDYPPGVAKWDLALARLVHIFLFVALLWMPFTGFLMSQTAGAPTLLFNAIPTPILLPKSETLAKTFASLHGLGQWFVYALIGLHLAGVALHVIWRRDGLVQRMLPAAE